MKSTGIICIDGPDCSAKSSLAQALVAANNGGEILHQTYRFRERMFTYHSAILHKAIKMSESSLVILDRLWMSEAIYGSVYRGGTKWPHEGRMVDRVLMKHAAVNIICSGDPHVISARHAELKLKRTEQFGDKMELVAQKFNELYSGKFQNAVPIDYAEHLAHHGGMIRRSDTLSYSIENEGQNVKLFCDVVLDALRTRRLRQYHPALSADDHNVLGHIERAEFLIVGDQLNPKSNNLRWPFYDYNHSSLFLSEALHAAGFDETRAMWTNINNSPEHAVSILDHKPLKVVALGNNAKDGLFLAGIVPDEVTFHPSWVKRFSPNYDYAGDLRQILGH